MKFTEFPADQVGLNSKNSELNSEQIDLWAYIYLIPAVIWLGIFLFYPLFRTIWISFFDWNLVSPNNTFVGFKNYLGLLSESAFWRVIWQSFLYILGAILGNFLVPLCLALLTLRFSDREASFYQSILFIPTVVPVSIGALLWLWIYLPVGGPLSTIIKSFSGVTISWLNDPNLALWSVSLSSAWKFLGFNYLLLLAGIKGIPLSYLEAAQLDGSKGFNLLRRVILPLLTPTLLFVFLTTVLQAMDNTFVSIQILTLGGPAGSTDNLLYSIFQDGFQFFQAGKASARSVLTLLLFAGAALWQFRLLDRWVSYER